MAKLITRIAEDLIDSNDIDLSCFVKADAYGPEFSVTHVQDWVRDRVRDRVEGLNPATCGILAHQVSKMDVCDALPSWYAHGQITPRVGLELLAEAALLLEIFRNLEVEARISSKVDSLIEEYSR